MKELKVGGVVLALIGAAALAAGCAQRVEQLGPADFEPFAREIKMIYTGAQGKQLKGVNIDTMSDAEAEAFARKLTAASKDIDQLKITAATGRKVRGREYVVKVSYTLGGKPGPDGKGVRYYLAEKRSLGGWRVKRETSASRFDRGFF